MTSAAKPRRRSCLSVPASAERKLAKAEGLRADEIVLDLEDGVLVDAKDGARLAVVHALADWQSGRLAAVRVNAPRTRWCAADIEGVARLDHQPGSIVLPKVESAGDLAFADRLLDGVEATGGRTVPLRIQALIETAAGLARVDEIAAASPRLDALILGYADLEASLGGARDPSSWLPAQHAVVVAARAAGIQAIDGPDTGVEVDDPFLAALERAREIGFDGKWAIHPRQIEAIEEAFTPTTAEIVRARAVIAALANADQGAIAVDGQMLDKALAERARAVLARSDGG